MLERRHRLTSSAGFSSTSRRGRRAGTRSLVVHVLEPVEVGRNDPRVGFVVSKAVGNAVTRNRVRRRLRHLVRERWSMLGSGAWVVVRALPAAAGSSYDVLGRDLDAALTRLHRSTGTEARR